MQCDVHTPREGCIRRFTHGAVRRAVLEYAINLCAWQRTTLTTRHRTDESYVQRRPFALRGPDDVASLRTRVEELVAGLLEDYPGEAGEFADQMAAILPIVADRQQGIDTLKEQCRRLYAIEHGTSGTEPPYDGDFRIVTTEDAAEVHVRSWAQDHVSTHRPEQTDLDSDDYLTAVSRCLVSARERGRPLSEDEVLAIHLAYTLVSDGERVPLPVRPWSSPGFRDTQSYMSITDPGEGHLLGTTRRSENLRGVVVHIEHLERGNTQDREAVEPYRIPAPQSISRVRLHTGTQAPVSSYVGRPMFEGNVADSLLKTVHTVSAACSALFMDGLTECKLAMERMTATEAIGFMRALAGNVRRNRHTQALSAAFNLNTPIVDDRPATTRSHGGRPRAVSDGFDVGLLGIELVAEAGFDKVTWDGTADTYPSRCVIEQITFEQAVTLVHRAHEAGLLTYFSAGFRFHHLADVTYTGTDGVGVGGAQILRYMDQQTGHHGPFKEENIARILQIRDEAAVSVLGQGAALLARLDQMFFEKSITAKQNQARESLYPALAQRDEARVAILLPTVRHARILPDSAMEPPVLGSARRLIAAGHASLAATAYTPLEFSRLLVRLERAVRQHDAEHAAELLSAARAQVHESDGTLSSQQSRSVA